LSGQLLAASPRCRSGTRHNTRAPERAALTGFLARYSGLTREAYALDSASVCHVVRRTLLCAPRADIESFGRELEAKGRARATIARRLGTVTGLLSLRGGEALIEQSPAVHVRKPRLDYESHAVGWTATRWVRSWWPRVWPQPVTTRWSRCSA
jgi:hypothetical protein